MKKETNPKIVVHIHYDENGKNVNEILKESVLYFIESEVKKLCIIQS